MGKTAAANFEEAVASERQAALKDLEVGWKDALERVTQRKLDAAKIEDYRLAAQLKEKELALRADPPFEVAELDRIVHEKKEAVAAEDFNRAGFLKARQTELESKLRHFDDVAAKQALAIA